MDHISYAKGEWATHQFFAHTLQTICHDQGATINWLSDFWIAHIKKGTRDFYINGYTFPINNATAAMMMNDKVSTYEALTAQHVPAVPHYVLRLPNPDPAALALQLAALPMVVKPNNDSSGRGVQACRTRAEVAAAMAALGTSGLVAVSPFVEISHEYRVIMLDTQALIAYEKQRPDQEWRHNLHFGATPRILDDETLQTTLVQLARRAMQALKGRLAAVDIVDTADGLKVLEVNGGIAMGHFAAYSPENAAQAREIYKTIIDACWQD